MRPNKEVVIECLNLLIEQGKCAFDKAKGLCRYRVFPTTPEEKVLKCAFGMYIPDEKYKPEMENNAGTCTSLVVKYPELAVDIDIALLEALQVIHDCIARYKETKHKSLFQEVLDGVEKCKENVDLVQHLWDTRNLIESRLSEQDE